jgi:hypothetical protein
MCCPLFSADYWIPLPFSCKSLCLCCFFLANINQIFASPFPEYPVSIPTKIVIEILIDILIEMVIKLMIDLVIETPIDRIWHEQGGSKTRQKEGLTRKSKGIRSIDQENRDSTTDPME